ncbi:unnamed protein product [Camellia sinensis]
MTCKVMMDTTEFNVFSCTAMASIDVWMKNASGKAPNVSVIFMSNRTTIEECFKRKLFGLPRAFVDFVKEVKAGMVLFLFEFEQRKLYGVFQAVTDGSMNIVPHAYRSTGKLFPAQMFPTKFNFGLSKGQCSKALILPNLIINPLADSGKLELERDDSMVESQARNSVDVLQSLNVGLSFFQALLMSGTSNEITSFHECAYRYSASSSFSGSQSVPLQKESEHIDISSYNASLVLGDYIPLSSPKHLDAKENGNAFSKAGVLEGRDQCDEKYWRTNEDASQVKEDPMDTWNGKQIGECIPLLDVNEEGKMLNIECETEGRNRVDGEEQQKRRLVRSMPRNKSNAKTDDNQTSLSQNDIKPALIYPTISDGNGEEQWKGLTNMDSMLRKQDGPGKNCFGEVGTKPLKATRKTRSISREKGESHLKRELV